MLSGGGCQFACGLSGKPDDLPAVVCPDLVCRAAPRLIAGAGVAPPRERHHRGCRLPGATDLPELRCSHTRCVSTQTPCPVVRPRARLQHHLQRPRQPLEKTLKGTPRAKPAFKAHSPRRILSHREANLFGQIHRQCDNPIHGLARLSRPARSLSGRYTRHPGASMPLQGGRVHVITRAGTRPRRYRPPGAADIVAPGGARLAHCRRRGPERRCPRGVAAGGPRPRCRSRLAPRRVPRDAIPRQAGRRGPSCPSCEAGRL